MAEPAVAVAPPARPPRPERAPSLLPAAPTRAPVGLPPPVGRLPIAPGPGEPLRPEVASRITESLAVDLSRIRVHSDAAAAEAADKTGARAFTVGSDIFLARNERPTDLTLIAHEVAHVVQQRRAPRLQRWLRWSRGGGDALEREAHRASAAVSRGETFTVRAQTPPRPQGLGMKDALDYFADKANLIPGFRMFTIVLGVNPINMSRADRSTANILRAVVEFIPGGALITQALDNYGVFEKAGAWIDQQLATLGLTWQTIKEAIDRFLDSLSWSDIFHLGDVWERAKSIFTGPINRVIAFLATLASGILKLIKEAILKPLAKLAEGSRGWDLLIAVLGENPITGDPVPRTAETLIGGFMKLIGQEEIWENMKKANAIPRAWAWFQGALADLLAFVREIPKLFVAALQALEIADIVLLPRAFMKVGSVFLGFLGRFISWAGNAMWKLLEIIFDVVSPGAWSYIKKTGAALRSILQNPLPFVGNLAKAAKLGFQQFADNFVEHLKKGLLDWLTGSLPGIYIPKSFDLKEIVAFVLSVLGLTWANIRGKLVAVVGEPAVQAMEAGFDIVVTLVKEGPKAAWEKLKEHLANLRDQVIGGIVSMVVETVIQKAIPKLVSMFIPGAGFITAIVSIYDMIMVFVQKIAKIIQVVTAFLDSIVAIAAGAIAGAAKRVETILAGLLSLAISFLAGFVGLGKVADRIMGVIAKIRAPIDKAIDAVINWIVTMAKKLFAKIFGKDKKDERTDEQKRADLDKAIAEADALERKTGATEDDVKQGLAPIKQKYKLTKLDLVVDRQDEASETVHVEGEVNPPKKGGQATLVKGKDRYLVGLHVVAAPPTQKVGGESHHVPVKVMKMWFGDVLYDAAKAADDPDLRRRLKALSDKCLGNTEGRALSAVWLTRDDHVTVHGEKPQMSIPVIRTKKGDVATRPFRTTIAAAEPTPFSLVGDEEQNPNTKELQKTFNRVFNQLLQVGLASVAGLKLTGKWRADLTDRAGSSWKDYMDVPQK